MSDPPLLLEARCTVFLRRLARQVSSAAAIIEDLTGEKPCTAEEVVVLAAELLGERAEELLALTPDELLQKLQALKRDATDGTVADPYAALRAFARNRLKGQERAVMEALCDAGGELPIADLALKDGLDWDNEFEGFKNAQKRLNPKLKRIGWTLARQNNAAKLNQIRG